MVVVHKMIPEMAGSSDFLLTVVAVVLALALIAAIFMIYNLNREIKALELCVRSFRDDPPDTNSKGRQ